MSVRLSRVDGSRLPAATAALSAVTPVVRGMRSALFDRESAHRTMSAREYTIRLALGEGDTTVPMVLNQQLYTLYADPTYVKDASKAAQQVASIIGGNAPGLARNCRLDGRAKAQADGQAGYE